MARQEGKLTSRDCNQGAKTISIVRQEYTLERLIERKLKLLSQIQRARKIQERAEQEAEKRGQK